MKFRKTIFSILSLLCLCNFVDAKKALVIIDMLNDFVKEGGTLVVPDATKIIKNIEKLREFAHQKNMLVIYANDSHAEDDPEFKVWPRHCVKDTVGAQIIDELKPEAKNIILEKQDFSFFTNPEAEDILQENEIEELYITGVSTEYCVKQGSLDAAENGYETYVIVDAIAGVDLKAGDQFAALLEMGEAGVKPLFTEKILNKSIGKKGALSLWEIDKILNYVK